MADIYEAKYKEMQKYVPFIQRVIERLKVNNDHQADNPRKAQLHKMEMLYDLLSNKQKKIRIETLNKCEGVLIKLQAKIEKQTTVLQNEDSILNDIKIKNRNSGETEDSEDLGPASPPPEIVPNDDIDQPVVIPTERRCSPVLHKETVKCSAGISRHDRTLPPDQFKHSRQDKQDSFNQKSFHSSLISRMQDYNHGKGSPHHKHSNQSTPTTHLEKDRNVETSKSSKQGQKLQTVKVVITEPLSAHFKQQHFPPCSPYSPRSSVCHNNLRTLPQAIQTKVDKNEVYSPEESWDQYNESHNERPHVKTPILSRLGPKVSEIPSTTTSKAAGRYTPIPDVLKSPPLSVTDINNLLLESGSDKTLNDISEIGTRRPPKIEDTQQASPNNSFELVRKKLAQTAKMNSPKTEKDDRNISSIPHERLALKYNPHPRQERLQSVSSTDGSECSTHSKMSDLRIKPKLQTNSVQHSPSQVAASNVNVLPAINLSDPRLKKQNILSTPTGRNSLPPTSAFISTPSMGFLHQSPVVCGSRKDPRISRVTNTAPSSIPTRRMSTTRTQYSSEENWDTDEEEKPHQPIQSDPLLPNKDQPKIEGRPERSGETKPTSSFERVQCDYRNMSPKGRECLNQTRFQQNSSVDKVPKIVPENSKDDQKQEEIVCKVKPKNKLIPATTFVVPNRPKSDTEEDWDSEPERKNAISKAKQLKAEVPQLTINSPSVMPKVLAHHPQISPTTFLSPKNISTAPIPPIHLTQIPSLQPQYPIAGANIHQNFRMHNSAVHNRFNSVMNDTSERSKYFEAKKQKSLEPRTYKEFREAKERALAQEAAIKRAAEEAQANKRANEIKESHKGPGLNENNNVQKMKKHDATKKTEDDKKEKKPHLKDIKKPSAGESALDKMYRTQNFNSNFPKSSTSFRIPKKKSEETTKEETRNTVEAAAEQSRHLTAVKSEEQLKPTQTDVSTKKIKTSAQVINDARNSNKTTNNDVKITQSDPTPVLKHQERSKLDKPDEKETPLSSKDSSIKKSSTPKPKPINESTNKQTKTEEISCIKKVKKENNEEQSKPQQKSQESSSENDLAPDDNQLNVRDPRCRPKTTPLTADDVKEKENEAEKFKNLGDIMITSSQNQVILKPQQNLEKFNKLTQELTPKPQRILQRRNTMVVFDSAPLVDKEKLKKANALLFEDIQEEEKRKRKQAEEDRINARRSKHLEEMFKKTDDNCTVSTQNIITGKRRTRATINFNETVNAINVFKHKTIKDTPPSNSTSTPSNAPAPKTIRSNFKIKIKNLGFPDKPKDDESDDDETLEVLARKESLRLKETHISKTKAIKEAQQEGEEDYQTDESEPENKISAKLAKKQTPLNKKSTTKPANSEEHQNCAVSSTSTDNCNLEESTSFSPSNRSSFKKEAEDNEPTSTASKSNNPTPTPEPIEPVLREIVEQILKPNTNREPILGILAQILSEEKLELIKSLIESSNRENEDQQTTKEDADKQSTAQAKTKTSSNINEDEDEEERQDDQKSVGTPKANEGKKMGMPKKKRNELDRLNEDIRDMFICNGVITATGRRMCTMMGKDIQSTSTKKSQKEPATSPLSEQENRSKGKTEIIKPPFTKRALRRSTRGCKTTEDNDDNESVLSRSTEDSIDDSNITDNSAQTDATPQRKMPVLKAHTPIKLPDEASSKSPKSKEVGNKRKSDVKPSPKIKKTKLDKDDSESEELELESQADVNEVEEETADHKKDTTITNTNVHWHNQSKYTTWCMICEKRIIAISSSLHYKTHHRENYISRMAPVLLQQFKQGKLNRPLFGVKRAHKQPTWFYRCPFCLKYFNTSMPLWLEHFQNHTVEFRYECSKCHRSNNRKLTITRHVKSCEGATVLTSAVKLSVPSVINAHVCHLCNFIQLKRDNLERHYIEQHKLQKKTVDLLGYTLKLFDVGNVECVNEGKAAEREKAAWKSIEENEQVIDIDDDDVVDDASNSDSTGKEGTAESKENSPNEENEKDKSGNHLPATEGPVNKKGEDVTETNSIQPENSPQEKKLQNVTLTQKDKIKPIPSKEEQAETSKSVPEKTTKPQQTGQKEAKKAPTEQNKSIKIQKAISSTKSKKIKTNIVLDLTESQSDDFEVIDEEVTVQNIQDELLSLAAEAAEKERKENTDQEVTAQEIQDELLALAARAEKKGDENQKPSENSENKDGTHAPQTTMSDIISSSIDVMYNRETVNTTNKRLSIDTSSEPNQVCPTASNVFMPTRDENNYSPTIQILAQSIINIDEQENTITKEKPITMAERLSQRFKDLQSEGTTAAKTNNVSATTNSSKKSSNETAFGKLIDDTLLELTKEKDSANNRSCNRTPAATPAIVQRKENVFDKLFTDTVLEIEKDDTNQSNGQPMQHDESTTISKQPPQRDNITVISDDEDWEDIEITETAPTVSTTTAIQKPKGKGLFQKFGIFKGNNTKSKKHLTPMVFLPKKKTKEKTPQTPAPAHQPTTTAAVAVTKAIETSSTASSLSNSNAHLGFKPVTNIMDGLFPDSPCNDPIDLVPELAPLEPLQDLNDISSILDSNLSAVNINAADNHTSIEDALDFISEQQANDKQIMPPSQSKNTINNISHVGFSVQSAAGNAFKFYCLLQNCSFLYSSDSVGLENHFMCEHSQIKWNGFCLMCRSNCFSYNGETNEQYSISKEIRHMMDKHANKLAIDPDCSDSAQNSNSSTQDNEERPKIKLRRLTGDCLSRATPENVVPCRETDTVEDTTVATPPITMLGALLVADPKPPTKEMPPKPQMTFTDPLLVDNNTPVASNLPFRNVNSDFLITSVTSASSLETNPAPLQISSVISLNNKSKPTTSGSEQIQIPKISNVRTLSAKPGGLWAEEIEEEEVLELMETAEESQEISCIMQNAGKPSTSREVPRSVNDSPVLVAETVPIAQSTTGDFVVTQTLSAQYNEFSSAALDFNISIAPAAAADNTNLDCTPASSASVSSRQYKCMGSGCKFVSRVPVAMSDHLRFHERRNFSNKQDYLACGFCFYSATDVEDYMKHANHFHIINKGSVAPSNITTSETDTASSLTKKIQNILNNNSGSSGQSRFSAQNQLPSQPKQVEDSHEVYLNKLRETIEEIVGPTGLSDEKLYRCVIKNCHSQLNENTFLNHIMFHITTTGGNPNNYVFKCPHCTAQYHRPGGIKAHIKNHARNRYFCYLCDETAANPGQFLKHFSEKHWYTLNMFTKQLLPPKVATEYIDMIIDSSFYVAYTQDLTPMEVRKFGEKLILEWQRKKSGSKTHFKSSEIDLLPMTAIFHRQVNCGECEYKTKVRTNMFRHLLMHKQNPGMGNKSGSTNVCSVDPVNPVPCLNSSERFFDKMTNLASSSLIPSSSSGVATTKSSFKLPQSFVEEGKRYVCGCPKCNYHTISEDLFRTHLATLHSTALTYCCPFCKEEICKRGLSSDRIMNHTRFHGTTIYRCEECNYVHHLRYVVERHINEKHSTMKVNIVTHNRSVEDCVEGMTTITPFAGKKYKDQPIDSNPTTQTPNTLTRSTNNESSGSKQIVTYVNSAKGKGKWVCDVCGHRTATVGQIQAHCQQQHAVKNQYKCAHCNFGSQQLSQILHHIDEKHSGKTREARYMYHKTANSGEEVADTRPLWQRNDPTRVRHIRGILMEDEEESEEYRKKLALTEDVDDDSNESLHAEVEESDEVEFNGSSYISGYEFSCYHCSFKTQTFEDLKEQHYEQNHNCRLETAKPFWYRLYRRLCCPECRSFSGNYCELQQHLQNNHKKARFYAADIRMAENDDTSHRILCGYCSFHCTSTELLYKHHLKAQHWPQDIRIDNDEQIMEILSLGKTEVSYQCTLCADIFPNRVAIVQHSSNCHAGDDSFSFKELANSIIYRCNSCCFTSTSELELLRHTIDHYGRFKVCSFCQLPQSSFNVYMQHCYAEHKTKIQKFKTIYPFAEIKKFLLQTLVIFSSGLVLSKRNLSNTQYGYTYYIDALYEEIYKISQQPPIPRLSIARLVARKSIEAQQKHVETIQDDILNDMMACPKNVSKRRCTVSFDRESNHSNSNSLLKPRINIIEGKAPATLSKRRTTIDDDQQLPQQHLKHDFNPPLTANKISKRRRTVAVDRDTLFSSNLTSSTNSLLTELVPVGKKRKSSFTHTYPSSPKYIKEELDTENSQKSEEVDLSKIYTKVFIGGIKTPLTIDKFKLLFNIDCQLKLIKCDDDSLLAYNEYKHIKKACPASEKLRYN